MLVSIAIMLLLGMFMGWVCKKVHLPSMLGMIVTGMVLGPYALNLLDREILNLSADLRRIALIIILMRAGLSLNIEDLKKVGRPAILMCFVPACFEIIGMMILAPPLLGISLMQAALMGAVVGAVSPAVIVPKMLKLMEEGYGTKQGIPQLLLAGASVDDVFVIVIFTVFLGLEQTGEFAAASLLQIPVSIALGIAGGVLVGYLLAVFFEQVHMRDTAKVIILLSFAFLLVTIEDWVGNIIPFSGLLAIMSIGIALQKKRGIVVPRLSSKFSKLWVVAEIMLFVLVGATVDIRFAVSAGLAAVLVLLGVLLFRMLGVFCCLIMTPLSMKERLFCMIGYMPKATVQAAIGGIPLTMGLDCGNLILTVAVLAILITAPLGAFLIELTYKRLLQKEA